MSSRQDQSEDRVAGLASRSVLETLEAAADLTKLADAFRAAGMEGYLDGPEAITLFAPTDSALAALDAHDIQGLSRLLRRQMTPGILLESELRNAGELRTLENHHVRVSVHQAGTHVGNARIVRPDIECSNGVIHVSDRVL